MINGDYFNPGIFALYTNARFRDTGVQVEHRSCQTSGKEAQTRSDSVTTFTQTSAFNARKCDGLVGVEIPHSIYTQTDISYADEYETNAGDSSPCRSIEDCQRIYMEQVRIVIFPLVWIH